MTVLILVIAAMALAGGLSQYVHEHTGQNTVLIPVIAGGVLILAVLIWDRKRRRTHPPLPRMSPFIKFIDRMPPSALPRSLLVQVSPV